MNIRIVIAAGFALLYILFVAWYDGWGAERLSAQETERLTRLALEHGISHDQIAGLERFAREDDGEPFFMLNLNRYTYSEGEPSVGAPAAYQRYGRAVLPMLLRRASHPIYSAELPGYLLSGKLDGDGWHDVILVRYRSRRDFLDMITSQAYQQIYGQRGGGIDYAEVTATQPSINLSDPRLHLLLLIVALAFGLDRLIRYRSGPL